MALITRRQFVQKATFSASAVYGYSFDHFEGPKILQLERTKSASVDVDLIRKLASKIAGPRHYA